MSSTSSKALQQRYCRQILSYDNTRLWGCQTVLPSTPRLETKSPKQTRRPAMLPPMLVPPLSKSVIASRSIKPRQGTREPSG